MARTILLVDDDAGYLLAARRLLEAAGYEVRTAGSAAEARKRLASQKPDLILLDVCMPAEDGLTFAESLEADPLARGVPVALVSVMAETSGPVLHTLEKGQALTVADILPKSAIHKHLVETVAELLGAVPHGGAGRRAI